MRTASSGRWAIYEAADPAITTDRLNGRTKAIKGVGTADEIFLTGRGTTRKGNREETLRIQLLIRKTPETLA
jgi:hypothetical protein